MAAKYEISVNRVSDDTGVISSATVGIVSFLESDPTQVTTINPMDYMTLLALKGYVDAQIKDAQKLAKQVGA